MLLDYFNSAPMLTLAIGQGGDYIGGEKATRFNDGIQPMRKARIRLSAPSTDRFNSSAVSTKTSIPTSCWGRGGGYFCPSYKSASTNSKRRATAAA